MELNCNIVPWQILAAERRIHQPLHPVTGTGELDLDVRGLPARRPCEDVSVLLV